MVQLDRNVFRTLSFYFWKTPNHLSIINNKIVEEVENTLQVKNFNEKLITHK